MTLNDEITAVLKPLAPTYFQTYSGSATTYITFNFNDETQAQATDDDESATFNFLQVDIWSKGDYLTLADQVKAALKSIGYSRTNKFQTYSDTGFYQCSFRFKRLSAV